MVLSTSLLEDEKDRPEFSTEESVKEYVESGPLIKMARFDLGGTFLSVCHE